VGVAKRWKEERTATQNAYRHIERLPLARALEERNFVGDGNGIRWSHSDTNWVVRAEVGESLAPVYAVELDEATTRYFANPEEVLSFLDSQPIERYSGRARFRTGLESRGFVLHEEEADQAIWITDTLIAVARLDKALGWMYSVIERATGVAKASLDVNTALEYVDLAGPKQGPRSTSRLP
jgi:hypothetical protein